MQGKSKFEKKREQVRGLIEAGLGYLKKEGLAFTIRKTRRFFLRRRQVSWRQYLRTPLFTKEALAAQQSRVFEKPVLISIVTPLYNTDERFLREMIASVKAQTYANWELCLADGSDAEHAYVEKICLAEAALDKRVRYRKLEQNLGIAGNSNAAIEMAGGDYIALLDHDDVLHPSALYEVMERICGEDADLIYTDEATFESPDIRKITLAHFKPDFAPDNLLANNYICHFTCFCRSLLEEAGMFRCGYDGAQDHDLMLRMTSKAKRIAHIPEVLYYWRAYPMSTAEAEGNKPYVSAAGIKAVSDHLKEEGIKATVTLAKGIPTIYRVSYELPAVLPMVSIIIANYDHADDLCACITSIKAKTTYPNYEIIVAENNSVLPETFAYYKELEADAKTKVIRWKGSGFNWAAINNYAVSEAAAGDYYLLLNNDTEVISPDWIEEMLMHAQRPEVGIVGAKLYFPDDTIQHGGVILGLGGVAGHAFYGVRRENLGYMGRLSYAQDMSAVTGACVMIRKKVWEEVGGIDETFAVNLNDIDLCMRIRKAGYRVIWTPFAELYHYESKSRGGNDTPEKKAHSDYESGLFTDRWKDAIEKGDPYYNPNLTLKKSDFSPKNRKEENL